VAHLPDERSYEDDGHTISLDVRGTVGIWEREASLGIWFKGMVSRDGLADDVVCNIGWRAERCLPWNGGLTFDSVPFADQTWMTFLEPTPDDGRIWGAPYQLACR
jgi:hypothetical protein